MIETFKDNFNYAKNNYSKARFIYNYIALPSLIIFAVINVFVSILLLGIDSKQNFTIVVVLFSLLVASVIVFLSFLPYVKKKDIEMNVANLKRFFEASLLKNPEIEYVLPRGNGQGVVDLIFEKDGYKIEDLKYSYDGFECALYTSNYLYKVTLIIVFKRTEIGGADDGENKGVVQFSLPLDINLLTLMNKYNIKIVNPDVLTFIRDNVEVAVKQILKYGKIQNNFYDVK